MLQLIQYSATAISVLLALVKPFVSSRYIFPFQMFLFPFSNIYIGGLALVVTGIGELAIRLRHRDFDFFMPRTILIPWTIWIVPSVISLFVNEFNNRNLFSWAEFIFDGLIGVVIANIAARGPERENILRALFAAAVVMSVIQYIHVDPSEDNITDYVWGINEAAYMILLGGIVVPLYWLLRKNSKSHVRFALLPFVISWCTYVQFTVEARAASSICILLVGFFILYVLTRRSLVATTAVSLLFVGTLFQVGIVEEYINEVFSLEKSFSNRERYALLEYSERLFEEAPYFGWGWGSIDKLFPKTEYTELSYPHPHNTYAHFAVEMGLFGLLTAFAIYGSLVVSALKLYHRGFKDEFFLVSCMFLVSAINSLSDDIIFGANRAVIFVTMLGISAAFLRMVDLNERKSLSKRGEQFRRRVVYSRPNEIKIAV